MIWKKLTDYGKENSLWKMYVIFLYFFILLYNTNYQHLCLRWNELQNMKTKDIFSNKLNFPIFIRILHANTRRWSQLIGRFLNLLKYFLPIFPNFFIHQNPIFPILYLYTMLCSLTLQPFTSQNDNYTGWHQAEYIKENIWYLDGFLWKSLGCRWGWGGGVGGLGLDVLVMIVVFCVKLCLWWFVLWLLWFVSYEPDDLSMV